MNNLPVALEHEPLVDAVFEVRFGGNPQLADIVPGFLFGKLGSKPEIIRLAAHEIPESLRKQDKNLEFAPLLRLNLGGYSMAIGDRTIIISSGLPYPKWTGFRQEIVKLLGLVAGAEIDAPVERYSLKYVNIIEAATAVEQISSIDIEISLRDFKVTEDSFSLKINRQEGDIIHLMSIITGATAKMADGSSKTGVVVDIDSIRNEKYSSMRDFLDRFDTVVESLKVANKKKFFSCITDKTLKKLGPVYE